MPLPFDPAQRCEYVSNWPNQDFLSPEMSHVFDKLSNVTQCQIDVTCIICTCPLGNYSSQSHFIRKSCLKTRPSDEGMKCISCMPLSTSIRHVGDGKITSAIDPTARNGFLIRFEVHYAIRRPCGNKVYTVYILSSLDQIAKSVKISPAAQHTSLHKVSKSLVFGTKAADLGNAIAVL